MRIAICDDNKEELKKISNLVQQLRLNQPSIEITINTFVSGYDLLNYIDRVPYFDVLILDIIMPGLNGIELAKRIRENNKKSKIIFITSSPEFAVDSYKVNAFYYLLKPFQAGELLSLLNKIFISIKEQYSKYIVVKEKTMLRRINIHTIQYVESIKHTLNFHLQDNEIIMCYAKMGDFKNVLLADARFIYCHQSFIVNMSCITKIAEKSFTLQDNTLIPIARSVYPKVKQLYIDYVFDKGASL